MRDASSIKPDTHHQMVHECWIRAVAGFSLFLLIGCTQERGLPRGEVISTADASVPPESRASTTPAPAETIPPDQECSGLGRVPASGQITYFVEDQLQAASPSGQRSECLLAIDELDENPGPPVWNARGDRVLIGDRGLSRDGAMTARLTEERGEKPQWSRPAGTSVVYVALDGALIKRSSYGGRPIDITFLERHDAVTYHPAGEHIATSGRDKSGGYGLYLATNLGTEPQLLARGEAARFITSLRFSQDGDYLYYTARHGPEDWHLHRLRIGADATLETLARAPHNFEYAVSPFDPGLFVWFVARDCAAGQPGEFDWRGRRLVLTPELRAHNLHPVGWLRNGSLVVRALTTGCGTAQPADIYVVSAEHPPVFAAGDVYGSVGVRVRIPPPPPPPGEEQEVVA